MADRSKDWFNQAARDLEQAKDSLDAGRHEWACFAAHQSAEKAVKALHLHRGQEAWGHVIAQLLHELPADATPSEERIDRAKVLDNFYISTRYPNAHPDGAPYEHYGSLQSDQTLGQGVSGILLHPPGKDRLIWDGGAAPPPHHPKSTFSHGGAQHATGCTSCTCPCDP